LYLHDELGHSVWNLLEKNWTETRVESTNTLVLQDLGETTNETVGETRLGNETNTGSLKRTEGNVGDELGAGGRGKVDSGTVVDSGLVAEHVDGGLLGNL